mgnify:CR=1 FL=1
MHNNFLDKRRRHVRLQPNQVDTVLPDHFSTSYPKFIKLLTYYYEFLGEEKSTELLGHLFATRDITETDITLLSYIEDELLLGDSYFESFATGDAQKRAAANFSNTLFRSKGTKFAIQWFFRSFFGIDVEIVETQEQIFKLNEVGSAIGPESLHYLTDDKLYQTFAYLVRSSVPISKWKDLFKLFVHPAGMYLGGELLVEDQVFASMISTQLVGQGLPTDSFYLQILRIAVSLPTTPPEFATWAQTTGIDGFKIADANLDGDSTPNSLDALIFSQVGEGLATHEQNKRWLDVVLPSMKEQPWYTNYPELYTTEEGVVSRRNNENYAVYVEPDSAEPEGTNFRVRLVGSNIPTQGGTYQYYIDKGETNIADFANGVLLPDSNNRQSIVMRDDSASIYLQTFHDSDESESDETFHVHFFDDENREVVIQPITIQDVEASYTMTESVTSIDEGDSVQFSISGSLVPNSGSTTLMYQVIPSAIDSADSADFVAGTFTPNFQPVDIRQDSGSFSVQTKIDTDNDTTETFIVKLYTGSNILKATSSLITINNVSPTFSVSPDPTVTVVEGSDVEIELTVDPTTVGTTVNYTIGGTDSRIITKTGSFVITAVTATYVLSATEASDVFETVSPVALDLVTSSGGFFNPELPHGGLLQIENQASSFQITPSIVGAQNGDNLNFNITGTNIQDGIRAGYFIDHVTTSDSDFSTPPPTDSASAVAINFTSNSGTVPFLLENNGDSDNEDFFFVLTNTSGDEVSRLGYTIIGDATYTMTTPSSPDEDGTVVSLFTTSAPDGQYYYYIAGTVNEDDFSVGWSDISNRQQFTVAGNNGVISLTLDEDQKREGTESFRIYVSDTASGSVLASTGDISVIDTSLPIYTIGMGTSITEGTTLSAYVIPDADNNNTENIYVNFKTILGDSADIVTPQPTAQSISTGSKLFTSAIGVKDSATGGLTVEATAHIGSYTGTQVASDTIIIQDATASYSLVTNKTDDSASEGDTIQFTFGGTNVPTGTYYYNVSDIKPKLTGSTVSAGSPIIYLTDVTNLTTGMEVRGIDFASGTTITSINTGSSWVSMSSSNTESGNVSSGSEVHFALPEVFDDFGSSSNLPFGDISHATASTSTFNVDIATDDDLPTPRIENYTMNVTASFGASATKTKAFTIGDMTVSSVPNVQRPLFSTNPDSFSSVAQSPDIATASVIFSGTGSPAVGTARSEYLSAVGSLDTELLGAWVDDLGTGFVASDFEIQATLVNQNGSNAGTPGNFGVWETLNADRTWNVTNAEPGEGNAIYCQAQISFTIREIADTSNAATFTYYLSALTEDTN